MEAALADAPAGVLAYALGKGRGVHHLRPRLGRGAHGASFQPSSGCRGAGASFHCPWIWTPQARSVGQACAPTTPSTRKTAWCRGCRRRASETTVGLHPGAQHLKGMRSRAAVADHADYEEMVATRGVRCLAVYTGTPGELADRLRALACRPALAHIRRISARTTGEAPALVAHPISIRWSDVSGPPPRARPPAATSSDCGGRGGRHSGHDNRLEKGRRLEPISTRSTTSLRSRALLLGTSFSPTSARLG